jgi:hypothetical protein
VVSGGHGEAGLPDFETLTGTGPQHSSQQVTDEIKRSLGIGPRRVRYDGPQAADDGLIMEEGPWDD